VFLIFCRSLLVVSFVAVLQSCRVGHEGGMFGGGSRVMSVLGDEE